MGWNTKFLDDLSVKAYTRSADSPQELDSSSSDEGPSTPQSGSSEPSQRLAMRPFQTTVEDGFESDVDDVIFDHVKKEASLNSGQPEVMTANAICNDAYKTNKCSPTITQTLKSLQPQQGRLEKTQLQDPEFPNTKPRLGAWETTTQAPALPPRRTVHFLDRRPVILHNRSTTAHYPSQVQRPSLAGRSCSEPGLTGADEKWGMLFDVKGEPTERLGQVLRGVGNYIIREFHPQNSVVVTPEKLKAFYTKYQLDSEIFPFHRVFNSCSRDDTRGLEFLFQDLQCQYHLIPFHRNAPPTIPALTPSGFERWMTLLIRATPGREARRLDIILAELPIELDRVSSNEQQHKQQQQQPEKLPREISRRLFPNHCHEEIYSLVARSFSDWSDFASLLDSSFRSRMLQQSPAYACASSPNVATQNPVEHVFRGSHRPNNGSIEVHHNRPSGSKSRHSSTSYNWTSKPPNDKHHQHHEPAHSSRTSRKYTSEQSSRRSHNMSPPPIGKHNQSYHHHHHHYQSSHSHSKKGGINTETEPVEERRSREDEHGLKQSRRRRRSGDRGGSHDYAAADAKRSGVSRGITVFDEYVRGNRGRRGS